MGQTYLSIESGDKQERIFIDLSHLSPEISTTAGYFFEHGLGNFEQNYEAALVCYENAAQQGDATGLNNVGWMHLNGYATPKDEKIALGYFYKAVLKGSRVAMVNIGNIHENKQEYEAALYWYHAAAKMGDRKGIFNCANMLFHGWGIEQDYKAAYNVFKALYDAGDKDGAPFYLGYYAENGLVSPTDYPKAIQYYMEGVENEDFYSCTNLGRMYALGIGCDVDKGKAYFLYKKAADLGDALGYTNMAWMYETGDWVAKDLKRAEELYHTAADMGEENAIGALKRFGQNGYQPPEN